MKIQILILSAFLFTNLSSVKADDLLISREPLPPESHDPIGHSSSSNEGLTEPAPCPLMPIDREDGSPNIQRTLEIAQGIYSALHNELEEDYNKSIEYAVNKLEDSIYIFNLVASESREEAEISIISCEEEIQHGLKTLNSAISLLEDRKCNGVHVTEKRCIPQEIADEYILSLKELHIELQSNPNICN